MSNKIGKVLLKVLGWLLIILAFVLLFLRLPLIQTKIAKYAASRLSKQTNTKVEIDKVAMNFIDNASLKGIYIEDLSQDTLLYAEEISIDIAFFQLIRKVVQIDKLSIENSVIKVEESRDSIYNFQFLIDAFATEDSAARSETSFLIDLDKINIQNLSAKAQLLGGNHEAKLAKGKIGISKFDLDQHIYILENVNIAGIEVLSLNNPVDSTPENGGQIENKKPDSAIDFPLKDLPIDLSIKYLDLSGAEALVKEEGFSKTENFDSRHIEILDLNFGVENFFVNKDSLSGIIKKFNLNLNDKVKLNKLTSNVLLSDRQLDLKDFSIETMGSTVQTSIQTNYDKFSDLANLDPSVTFSLDIPSSNISVSNLSYFLPSEAIDSFQDESLKLMASAEGSFKTINLQNLNLSLGNTQLRANGQIRKPTDFNLVNLNKFEIFGKTDYREYAVFLPDDTLRRQFSQIGNINFETILNGGRDQLRFEDLTIYTESLAEAKFSGTISDIDSSDILTYDLKIHHISSAYEDLVIFADSLPSIAAKFDTVRYSGQAEGTLHEAILDGGFATSLGEISTNIQVKFNDDYTDALFIGGISLNDFQIGDLLNNDSLSTISLEAELNGRGLDPETIYTEIDATIYQLGYNNYTYKNIGLDGLVDGKKFNGNARIEDKNIKLDFQGFVDINDSIPLLSFILNLDTLNLKALNFSDEMLQIQLDIDANMAGLDLDEVDGNLLVKNIQLRNDKHKWSTDSIKLKAINNDIDKSLLLEGDFINAKIQGEFELSLLPDATLDFLDQYFPLKSILGTTVEEDSILNRIELTKLKEDVIEAHLKLFEITELAQFFDLPISRFDTASLDIRLDFPNNLGNCSAVMPALVYDGYYIERSTFSAGNQGEALEVTFAVDSISLSENIHLSQVDLGLVLKDQNAELTGLVKNQKQESSLGFTSMIRSEEDNKFSIDLIKDFILNTQKWELNQRSSIMASNDGLSIPEIQINNGEEAFSIQGTQNKIDLSFTDFKLSNIVEIVGIDSFQVSGLMNGALELGLQDEAPISGDLLINEITFNEFEIGDLDLKAVKEGQDVIAFLNVKGDEVLMEGDLSYDLSSAYLFGKVLVEKLNLAPFNPLVTSYANDLQGSMQGYLAIEGELEDPMITGALYFQEVEAFIKDLATKYRIKEGRINVSDDLVKPTATLEDEAGRLSFLKGEITHDLFTDITFDLDFNANEFLFLNSKQNKREYYYGDFVGKVDAKITGSSELPIITADIAALNGTDFTIQLLSSEAVLTKEDYILFYDGSEITTEEAIDSISRKAYQANSAVELNLNISTTEAALFHVIVDPVTGDRLDIRGNSNLVVNIPAYGDIKLVGDYIVKEGRYRVSYENTISRTFKLSEDSKISFQGDPNYATLDMAAIYETEVNTSALLERSGSQISNVSTGTLRSKINVELQVEGTLSKPELSFDIVVPESSNNPVGNELTSALAQLRQNETQLLEQVGSLILFNSFTGSNSGGNISNMGTSTAISSVGNLIDNQLNRLASNADGFEIDFNIDQYRDASNSGNANVTEFGIGLQQKLFNDRLIISAGGNANLETGQSSSNNFSSFAGDFVIQYLLSRDGKLRVKVFQKSDFNALSNDNIWKTGAGLTYKRKFGQIKPKE